MRFLFPHSHAFRKGRVTVDDDGQADTLEIQARRWLIAAAARPGQGGRSGRRDNGGGGKDIAAAHVRRCTVTQLAKWFQLWVKPAWSIGTGRPP